MLRYDEDSIKKLLRYLLLLMPPLDPTAAAPSPRRDLRLELGLLLAALACGCSASSQTGSAPPGDPPPAAAERAEIVAVVAPDRQALARTLVLTGELKAYQSVEVHARVAGYIRRMYVDVGDSVKAGAPLAEIEVPELANELTGAEATGQQLEAEIGRMERELDRAKSEAKLAEVLASRLESVQQKEPGLIARQESDEASLKYETALSRVRTAEAALGVARQRAAAARALTARSETMLEFRKIAAPFSGVVTHRFADPGAMVRAATSSASQPIVRLAQIDRLRLVVPIPEENAAAVQVGTPVEVSFAAVSKTVPGRVSRRSNELRRSTSTMDVEIDIPNPDRSLLPGMYADVTFSFDNRASALTVPVQAVTLRGDKSSVFVVDSGGQVAERDVHIGLATETHIEVTAGLEDGDSVIVGDRSRLEIGQKVQTKVVTVG
ncbi:MAG: efflux RND transporter periplasmic adaptor subunit [Acidobacteria bacterium]|nr:efflux RND transporter periplasmic adaptor subunit [Acidobacteriota bacterium]